MSLSRLAIRISTVAALQGQTWAGDAVKDSAIPPFDQLADDEKRPFIAVYTDDGEFSAQERDLFSNDGSFSLIIEMGVTAKMQFQISQDEIIDAPGMPPTDAQMEMTLDVMERQVKAVLHSSELPWANMWRRLVNNIVSVKTRRGADTEKGVRFAGRMIEISLRPYKEPTRTDAPGPLWSDLIAMLEAEADPGLQTYAGIIKSALAPDAPMPEWRGIIETFGLTKGEADAMQLTNPHDQDDRNVAAIDAQPASPA